MFDFGIWEFVPVWASQGCRNQVSFVLRVLLPKS